MGAPHQGVSDWSLWTHEQMVQRHERYLDEMGIPDLSVQERAAFRPLLQEAYRQQVVHAKRLSLLTVTVATSALVNTALALFATFHHA